MLLRDLAGELLVKKVASVSIPLSLARRAVSRAGSMPRTLSPRSLKARSKVPSLLPISTTSEPGRAPIDVSNSSASLRKCSGNPSEIEVTYLKFVYWMSGSITSRICRCPQAWHT